MQLPCKCLFPFILLFFISFAKVNSQQQNLLKAKNTTKFSFNKIYEEEFLFERLFHHFIEITNADTNHFVDSVSTSEEAVTFKYDTVNYLTEKYSRDIEENVSSEKYSYDINGNLIHSETCNSGNENFGVCNKKDYTYNSNNQLIFLNHEEYDDNSGTSNFTQRFYSYDENNKLSYIHIKKFSTDTDTTTSKAEFTYDNNGNLTLCTYMGKVNDSWINKKQAVFTFDDSNMLIKHVVAEWDNSTNNYNNNLIEEFKDTLGSFLYKYWNNKMPANSFKAIACIYDTITNNKIYTLKSEGAKRESYIYGENGNLTQIISDRWDSTASQWVDTLQYNLTYDAFNNLIEIPANPPSPIILFDSFGNKLHHSVDYSVSKMFYKQKLLTEITFEPINMNNFYLGQNYPNPFNPSTFITYQIPDNQNQTNNSTVISLVVYNILGKKIATLVNKQQKPGIYKVQFDATEMPSGVYYYQLKIGNFSQVKKMMLLK